MTSQVAIARQNIEKQDYELQEIANRVAMDVRVAFNELLLNRAKTRVREDSVRVLEEELKSQQERLSAGIVGTLNVSRAEVTLANERPELINARTQLKNSYLRLGELCGINFEAQSDKAPFEISGELNYHAQHAELSESLASADTNRPEIKARQKDIEIQDRQYKLDQSELRPQVQFFSGYEVYSDFFFQAEDGIRDLTVTGVQTCALPISSCYSYTMDTERRNRSVWIPKSCGKMGVRRGLRRKVERSH